MLGAPGSTRCFVLRERLDNKSYLCPIPVSASISTGLVCLVPSVAVLAVSFGAVGV